MEFLVNGDEKSLAEGLALAPAFGAHVTILETAETRDSGRAAAERFHSARIDADLIRRPTDWLRALRVVTRAYKYDLVIVGKMWQRGLSGLIFGNLPRPLLSDIGTNVMIVRHDGGKKIKRVLIALGGGPTGKQVLRWGGLIARAFDAQPVLFHATPQLPGMFFGLSSSHETLSQFMRSNTSEAQAFQIARDTLQLLDITPELKLGQGDVVEAVLEEARVGNYDLIVLGSSFAGRATVRLFSEPVTERIVQRSPCPVLVVRREIESAIFGAAGKNGATPLKTAD